jgi:hypothetical protein
VARRSRLISVGQGLLLRQIYSCNQFLFFDACAMTLLYIWVSLLLYWAFPLATSSPLPFPDRAPPRGNGSKIPVQTLYSNIPLQDIPTTVGDDVFLSNNSDTRYGYHFGRPVDRFIRIPVIGFIVKPIIGHLMSKTPSLLHWGILISKEPPNNSADRFLHGGAKVYRPESGIIFELRNSDNTGLIYLDVKNWTSYPYRQEKVKYLGTLNKTDEELITIGRAYIQQVGREGFHNFFRNCQIFTSWYSKALWPRVLLSTRADQLFGKGLWWFRDWNKTVKWGSNKFMGWLGFGTPYAEDLDSAADFVEIEQILSQGANSVRRDVRSEETSSSEVRP